MQPMPCDRFRAHPMKKSGAERFVVVEGSTVVGSFLSLRDALEFRTKSSSRSTRIVADHGEFDTARPAGAARRDVWMRRLLED